MVNKIFAISLFVLFIVTGFYLAPKHVSSQVTQNTATFQVTSNTDDVNEVSGTFYDTSDFWVGTGGSATDSFTGARFTNVTIPKNANIVSAHLEFNSATTQWIGIGYDIYAEASGNSATFSSTSLPSQRALTTAKVSHASDNQWVAGSWYNSDETRTVLQEIVQRSDWTSGNSLSFIVKGTFGTWGRKFVTPYNSNPALSTKLVVTYEDFAPTPTPSSSPSPSTTPTPTPSPSPSNIVVIMTDDQDAASIQVMNKVKSLLGDNGITFTNSFVDNSLCCPSRATFLTGQASHNNGVFTNGPPDGGYGNLEPTLGNSVPVWLQQAGFDTAHIGKMPNGFTSTSAVPPGWDTFKGLTDPETYRYSNYQLNENGVLNTYNNCPDPATNCPDYQTDVLSQKAVAYINSRVGNPQPFFLTVTPLAPHVEFPAVFPPLPRPAPRHLGTFGSLPLPTPPSFNEADVSDKPSFISSDPLMDATTSAYSQTSFQKRRETLLAVDDMVESIVNALQSSGKLNDTVIIFTSDNGFFHGEHRQYQGKLLLYEESIRVPLIISGKGVAQGQTRSQIVNNVDIPATILELAKATPGRTLDGRSLVPLLQDPGATWRSALLVQGTDDPLPDEIARYKAVRTDRFIYGEHTFMSDGHVEKELYDLTVDPYQLESKHADSAYNSVTSGLQSMLTTLATCVGVSCWMTTSEPAMPIDSFWSMDETSWNGTSGEVVDSSGNSNHATASCNGTVCTVPTTTTGKLNNGGSFDGVDDYLLSSKNVFDPSTTDFTVAIWFKPTSIGTFKVLMAQQDGTGTGRYWLAQTAGGLLTTNITGAQFNGTTTLSPNIWYHGVLTKVGSILTLYLNGIQESTASGTVSSASGNTVIGANKLTNANFFLGTLDEARIYKKALTAQEVLQLYNSYPNEITISRQPNQSSDDVNEVNNSYSASNSTLWIGNANSTTNSFFGARFTNFAVPKGATIKKAYLEVYSVQTQWIGQSYNMYADNVGNSPTFSSTSRPSQRVLTQSFVPHSSNVSWSANTWYTLDDMSQVVQEIVNRSDWQSGNSVSVIIKGTGGNWARKFIRSFDGSPTFAPKLTVVYQ